MGYSGKQTCPRCGRVLVGFQPCPNCAAGVYAEHYPAYGQGVSSPTVGPRLVLLLGAILLLSGLVFLIAPRGGSRIGEGGDRRQPDTRAVGGGVSPLPATRVETGNSTAVPANEATRKSAEEEAFWRKKLERDLREVGEYTPTAEEKAYYEQMRWQDHFSLSEQTRTSDFYLRRPELTGSRR